MDLRSRKAETKRRSLSEKDLRRGRRFWCCISLRPFRRTDPGLAFYGKNLQFQFAGILQIFGNATKDRSIYQNRIDKALREWYCNHILREGLDRMRKMFDHTVAAAAKADAVSSCAASSRSMIAIIMDAIMASIFVAIISIIGTIPYGWRGVQNG